VPGRKMHSRETTVGLLSGRNDGEEIGWMTVCQAANDPASVRSSKASLRQRPPLALAGSWPSLSLSQSL